MEANDHANVDITYISKEQCEVVDSAKVQRDENEVLSNISLVDQLESKLEIGQIVKSLDDAYLLYCSYVHAKGFSVKKGAQRYFAQSSELQSKEFECSCEGKKDERCSKDKIIIYQKPSTRTDCKAKLKITKERDREVEEVVSKDTDTSAMIFVNQTMRSTYDLCMWCKGNEEAKNILVGSIEDAKHQLDELFENLDIDDKCNTISDSLEDVNNQNIDVVVRNPKCAKTRGTRNARIVRHWEKSKIGKGKGKVNHSNAKTSRKKRLSSQETYHTTPAQRSTLDCDPFQPFAPYLEINQPWPYCQSSMQNSGNFHFVHPHPSQDPKSSM